MGPLPAGGGVPRIGAPGPGGCWRFAPVGPIGPPGPGLSDESVEAPGDSSRSGCCWETFLMFIRGF